MFDSSYFSVTAVQLSKMADSIDFFCFESCSNLKNFILKGIKKELILFFFECLFDSADFVDDSKNIIVRPDLRVPYQQSTDRTRNRLVRVKLKHALDASVAKEMRIGACKHRPSSHDMVRLKTDITKVTI